MRFPVNRTLPLAALILLSASGAYAADRAPPPEPVSGPAADYPVVVGEPYTIGDTVWTPVDQLNYDAVGNAGLSEGAGITGAHKTLPLPSYVEVTALDSGRTILVRLERRGPMVNDELIGLSAEAAAQLGLAPGSKAPVRVRRVNPPEQERALLRTGSRAPERMETPEGLLKVLRRKLVDQSPLLPPSAVPPAAMAGAAIAPSKQAPAPKTLPAAKTPPAKAPAPKALPKAPAPNPAPTAQPAAPPPPKPITKPTPKPTPRPAPVAAPAASTEKGAFVIQVAAFSSEASARKVAAQLGGTVAPTGKFWRVRLGPYANRAKAGPALEKAKHAGYSDARILGAE
jgi:rare lipoprotein A